MKEIPRQLGEVVLTGRRNEGGVPTHDGVCAGGPAGEDPGVVVGSTRVVVYQDEFIVIGPTVHGDRSEVSIPVGSWDVV